MSASVVGSGWWQWLYQEESEANARKSLTWPLTKRILAIARPLYSRMALLLLFMLLHSLFALWQPMLFSSLIDNLFWSSNKNATTTSSSISATASAPEETTASTSVHVLGLQIFLVAILQAGVTLIKSRLSTQISEGKLRPSPQPLRVDSNLML